MVEKLLVSPNGGNGCNYYTYNPRVGWYGNMFDTTMPQIYTGYFQIRDLSDAKGLAYQYGHRFFVWQLHLKLVIVMTDSFILKL